MVHRHGHSQRLTPAQASDLAGSFDEDELDERIETLCLATVLDGAGSLSDAAAELHEFAEFLRDIERDGWQLVETADGAHAYVVNDDPEKRIFEPEMHEARGEEPPFSERSERPRGPHAG
jgi:hypothetical protein